MKASRVFQRQISRRRFLNGMAASAAAFHIVPGSALGLNGATPANERLNVAAVGAGGQAGHDIRQFRKENVVALCDVDDQRAAGTFREFPDAKKFKDFRVMLDQMESEIDAVVVGTPDHLHAFASIMALRMGKHVYCEKPLTHSVWEARRVAEMARKSGRATQMGNQGQASADTRQLCELVWHNAIGPVREAHVWTDRPSRIVRRILATRRGATTGHSAGTEPFGVGFVDRSRAAPALSSDVLSVQVARLVGFRHRGLGRYRVSFDGSDLSRIEAGST